MIHADQAYGEAQERLREYLRGKTRSWRILLINDLFFRLRVILWCPPRRWEQASADINGMLQDAAPAYWSGDVLKGNEYPEERWQDKAWKEAECVSGTTKLRVVDRERTKEGWFQAPDKPPWPAAGDNPAIVAFYSFKGGVGRSTALAATALHLAAAGERVAVLDFDLDAPGVGWLLAGNDGATAPWGIADYLLERPLVAGNGHLDLGDYYHRCPASLFAGKGEIAVFPAGSPNRRYIQKLARMDYGAATLRHTHPFVKLLQDIRKDRRPHWILVDARAGLGNVSGFVMGGLCHVHVLAGTLADASWRGLAMILDRLGALRVSVKRTQAECVLAAAMVPRSQEHLFRELVLAFTERARGVFSDHYYAKPDQGAAHWNIDDVESADAPHVPVVLPYDERLAGFRDLGEVANEVLLQGRPYQELVERVRTGRQRTNGLRL